MSERPVLCIGAQKRTVCFQPERQGNTEEADSDVGVRRSDDRTPTAAHQPERTKSLHGHPLGNQMIGKMLAKAPAAEDDVWPCLPVRDALEQVANHHIEQGAHFALRNARGAHWWGEGGAQERELAAQYRGWAEARTYTHPRVAVILRNVEKAYLSEADWQDTDAKVARRMRY